MRIINVSNPAAFGAEITDDDGGRCQLVQPRGTSGLYFGMAGPDGKWSAPSPVCQPERFGITGPCKTAAEFMRAAERFAEPYAEPEAE